MPLKYEKKSAGKQSYIEITGFDGNPSFLTIPEMVDELPVQSIGKSAFAGRPDLQEVILPKGIRILCRNAFYNCPKLRHLCLFDGIEDYYDGVIRQCSSLNIIDVYLENGDYSIIKEMLSDNDRQLHFILHLPQGNVHLFFPAYVYDFVEDVEARVLHHKIEGVGYPYRECVTRKGIDYRAYDRLFGQAVQEDRRAAMEIAFCRLLSPHELERQAMERYEHYLEQYAEAVLSELIQNRDLERITYMAEHCLIPKDALPEAMRLAAEVKEAVMSAIFMEYQKEHFGKTAQADDFLLDDW